MPQSWKPFILGVVCAMLLGAAILFGIDHRTLLAKYDIPQSSSASPGAAIEPQRPTYPPIPADAIKIQPLPPLMVLSGTVKFEGKKELPLRISGNYAKNISVASFKASGENAHKSVIKIVWMDGSSDVVFPGTVNFQLPSNKFAKQIIVIGYSVYERKIFKDSARPGTVQWDIRYEAVNDE